MTDKQSIIKTCSNFKRPQRCKVLKFLVEMGVTVCEGADGSRTNLDKLNKKQLLKLKKRIMEIDKPVETKFRIE